MLVAAPADLVFETARNLDLWSIPAIRAIFWLREKLLRSTPSPRPSLGLVAQTLALGRQEHVALRWWAPWNEPNHPAFVSPQRTAMHEPARPNTSGSVAPAAETPDPVARASGGEAMRTVPPVVKYIAPPG